MKTKTLTDRAEMEAIMVRCPYCMVGLTDDEGAPYVVPMNFAYADGVIYLHSGPGGSKVRFAEQRPRVWQRDVSRPGAPVDGLGREAACPGPDDAALYGHAVRIFRSRCAPRPGVGGEGGGDDGQVVRAVALGDVKILTP